MLADCTSASIPVSQVTARWWSCPEYERATWPKKRSLLVLMILEIGGQPVVCLLVLCQVYGIQRIFRRDHPCVKGIQSPSKSLCDSPYASDPYITPGGHRFNTAWPLCRLGYVTSEHASPSSSYNSWQYQCAEGSRTHYCRRKWCMLPSMWIHWPPLPG